MVILRLIFSLFLVSWPTPQSGSHHKQLWSWEIEHSLKPAYWGGGCSKRVDNSALQEGGRREWHVPVWSLLFTWLHSSVLLLVQTTYLLPSIWYHTRGPTGNDNLPSFSLFVTQCGTKATSQVTVRRGLCRYSSVPRKISFRYYFNDTKANNYLRRQLVDVRKRFQNALPNNIQCIYFILKHNAWVNKYYENRL